MIQNKKIIHENILRDIQYIKKLIYTPIGQLQAEAYVTKEPVSFCDRQNGTYEPYSIKDKWGNLFNCAWFYITGIVDEVALGKKVVLLIDIGGEACIYDEDGCPEQGLTNVKSGFDHTLGFPGKKVYVVTQSSKGNEKIDLWMDAGCNDLFGELKEDGRIQELSIAICNDDARDLYYDLVVLENLLCQLDKNLPHYSTLLFKLQKVLHSFKCYTSDEFIKARNLLKDEFSRDNGISFLKFHAIGHAHMDLAWLWPIRETKRKVARTFSTVNKLMDRYPDYVFGASQAQQYKWIETEHPKLFEKIQRRVQEGRWEVQGGMWAESDTNIPSGESLVRQLLYGKRYFREKFNQDIKLLWLPDVFGYTASLPQIMKKSGIDYFTTIKLSWNKINTFPYHTFTWKGISNDEVLVHMPPEGVYNSAALPESFAKAGIQFIEKGLSDKALCMFGIGDGGGGPGTEHLERLKRLKNLTGLYPVKQGYAIDFFNEIDMNRMEYPRYSGELFFEMHLGTLTTQSKNKKYNRILEKLLKETEMLCSIASIISDHKYPRNELMDIWEEVLLYQFHDILPGSSIKRVYEESVERYIELEIAVKALQTKALQKMADGQGTSYFNIFSWTRTILVNNDGKAMLIKLIPLQATSIESSVEIETNLNYSDSTIENEMLVVTFNVDGFVTSIWDKEMNREIIPEGKNANELRLYPDRGDAWDFDFNYRENDFMLFKLQEFTTTISPINVIRTNKYSYGTSTLIQEVVLEASSRVIDFRTKVDWNEKDLMLRAEFPVNIVSDEVCCDIQFGNIKRSTTNNTPWDAAKVEICAHKWIDMSEFDYGVSLLNDCKYGHYAKGNTMSIGLLRSQSYPCNYSDLGIHTFSYALYPHKHHLNEADVEQKAYEYNHVPILLKGSDSLILQLISVEDKNIIVETIKMSEESDGIIFRLYENRGKSTKAKIKLNNCFETVKMTNMIEDEANILEMDSMNQILLEFKPFEVFTFKACLGKTLTKL